MTIEYKNVALPKQGGLTEEGVNELLRLTREGKGTPYGLGMELGADNVAARTVVSPSVGYSVAKEHAAVLPSSDA